MHKKSFSLQTACEMAETRNGKMEPEFTAGECGRRRKVCGKAPFRILVAKWILGASCIAVKMGKYAAVDAWRNANPSTISFLRLVSAQTANFTFIFEFMANRLLDDIEFCYWYARRDCKESPSSFLQTMWQLISIPEHIACSQSTSIKLEPINLFLFTFRQRTKREMHASVRFS